MIPSTPLLQPTDKLIHFTLLKPGTASLPCSSEPSFGCTWCTCTGAGGALGYCSAYDLPWPCKIWKLPAKSGQFTRVAICVTPPFPKSSSGCKRSWNPRENYDSHPVLQQLCISRSIRDWTKYLCVVLRTTYELLEGFQSSMRSTHRSSPIRSVCNLYAEIATQCFFIRDCVPPAHLQRSLSFILFRGTNCMCQYLG